MSARSTRMDSITLYTNRAMVNMAEGKPFQNKITDHIFIKPFHYTTHSTQVTKSLFTYICHKPQIMIQYDPLILQSPKNSKQGSYAKGIIPNPWSNDFSRFFFNL